MPTRAMESESDTGTECTVISSDRFFLQADFLFCLISPLAECRTVVRHDSKKEYESYDHCPIIFAQRKWVLFVIFSHFHHLKHSFAHFHLFIHIVFESLFLDSNILIFFDRFFLALPSDLHHTGLVLIHFPFRDR